MPPERRVSDRSELSQLEVKRQLIEIDQAIIDRIAVAFGDDVAYHIKESGPTWVNSPHHAGDERVSPELKPDVLSESSITIVIHQD